MHRCSLIRIFLSLLVVGAHSHCVLAHGGELLRAVETSKCAESPIGDGSGCENESGCICKGATLGERLDVTLTLHDPTVWLTQEQGGTSADLQPAPDHDSGFFLEPAPPPESTVARALLQSFQI